MDTILLRAFQLQILLQTKFALSAATDINAALKTTNVNAIFCAIQNFLNATANISKCLWGSGGKLAAERKTLRDSIGVTDSSPLKEVSMRNNFEHFDERLDRWFNESTKHNMTDLGIGPKDAIAGFEDVEKFRRFDPTSTDVIFWGQEFNIQTIVNELQSLFPKLDAEANNPHWDTKTPARNP